MIENKKQKTTRGEGTVRGNDGRFFCAEGFVFGNVYRAKYIFCLFGTAFALVANTLIGLLPKGCAVIAYPATVNPEKITRAEKVVVIECEEGETNRVSCPVGVAIEGYTEMIADFEGEKHNRDIFSSLVGAPYIDFMAEETYGKYKLSIKWCDYFAHEAFVMEIARLLAPSGARVTVTECTYPIKSDICGADAVRRRGAEPSDGVMSACPQYAKLASKIKSVCLRLSVNESEDASKELLSIVNAVTSKEW